MFFSSFGGVSISFRGPPGFVSWQGRVVSSIHSTQSFIAKSAAGGLTRGRLHRRHTTPRDVTKGRPKKQPKKEPKPGHKRGTGKREKASLRKGRTTDKEGMVGHGVRKTPRSVRSYERSREMRWVSRKPWVFCGIISKFEHIILELWYSWWGIFLHLAFHACPLEIGFFESDGAK